MNKFVPFDTPLKRPVAKLIGYGLVSSFIVFLIVWFISQNVGLSLFFSFSGFMVKPLLLYFNGKAWQRSKPDLPQKENVPDGKNLKKEYFTITRRQKESLLKQKAFVLWFTGFSGAGKSTIARALEEKLYESNFKTIILDGDNIRIGLNKDLDFSAEGRKENIRRIAEVARLFNDAGIIVITCFISPFEADRESARQIIGQDSFFEVFINSPLEKCIERDTKGLYKKALKGEIKDFTGINSPYEIPRNPDFVLNTNASVDQSIEELRKWLKESQLVY